MIDFVCVYIGEEDVVSIVSNMRLSLQSSLSQVSKLKERYNNSYNIL